MPETTPLIKAALNLRVGAGFDVYITYVVVFDAYFVWVKESLPKVPTGGSTYKALQYSLNQEEYLRFFLTDEKVPMDNNTTGRTIRPFTLGRKNWVTVDSIRGAEATPGQRISGICADRTGSTPGRYQP